MKAERIAEIRKALQAKFPDCWIETEEMDATTGLAVRFTAQMTWGFDQHVTDKQVDEAVDEIRGALLQRVKRSC